MIGTNILACYIDLILFMKQNTSWGKVADWYDEYLGNEDSYQKNVILPNLLRIVHAKPGDRIVDVACGQGYFSESLALEKAQVIGVDISPELIRKAEGRFADRKIKNAEFHVSPADNLGMVQTSTAETAICVLALQNIKELDQTFAEVARILRKPKNQDTVGFAIKRGRIGQGNGEKDDQHNLKNTPTQTFGRFVFVLNHPAFRIPQSSDWFFDERSSSGNKGKQGRVVYEYLSEGTIKIDMNPGIPKERVREKKYTISYHRPLQVFVKLLAKHGFAVTRLEEWSSHKKSQEGPRANAENNARKEIPMFMCIEASLIRK